MVFDLVSFLIGFLTSSIIDTSLGEFNEWAVVGASLVIANIELFNYLYYYLISRNKNEFINRTHAIMTLYSCNYFKLGVVYGLIVDAFKLGS